MARRLLVDDLISEVRAQINEQNEEVVSDEFILQALNRAQDAASNILARHYESPMITFQEVPIVSGQTEYDIPEDAFEQRLEKVELKFTSIYQEVPRIDYRDITPYDQARPVNIPYYYCIIGRKYRLVPSPTTNYPLRIWYLKDPEPFVKNQGTIQIVNTSSNYIIVDEVGSELSTEVDQLNSYFNIIDGQTGQIKGTFQILNISGNKISIKSSPNRSTVLNKTILNSLADLEIEPDDVISTIHGSCVPFYKKPFSNYIIQYAVSEITRALGGESDMEARVLSQLEDIVKKSWVGRENTMYIKRKNKNWPRILRRFFISNGN